MARGLADVAERAESVQMPRAFPDIYAAYFGFVWRCLRGHGVPERQLDDAAQDVFIAVHRRLAEFRGESTLRTWLYGIVRNVAQNQRRSERRRGGVMEFDAESASPGPSPHEHMQDREAAAFALINQRIVELPETHSQNCEAESTTAFEIGGNQHATPPSRESI